MEIEDVDRRLEKVELHADRLEERLRMVEAKLTMISGFWVVVGVVFGSGVTIMTRVFEHFGK